MCIIKMCAKLSTVGAGFCKTHTTVLYSIWHLNSKNRYTIFIVMNIIWTRYYKCIMLPTHTGCTFLLHVVVQKAGLECRLWHIAADLSWAKFYGGGWGILLYCCWSHSPMQAAASDRATAVWQHAGEPSGLPLWDEFPWDAQRWQKPPHGDTIYCKNKHIPRNRSYINW